MEKNGESFWPRRNLLLCSFDNINNIKTNNLRGQETQMEFEELEWKNGKWKT